MDSAENSPITFKTSFCYNIYKAFIRPHLYLVILCLISQMINHLLIQLRKHSMMQQLQSLVQSEGYLGEKYMLDSLKFRQWFRKLTFLYKIPSTGLPKYLLQLIPTNSHSYILRKPLNIPHHYCRTDTFKNLFFSKCHKRME